MFPTTHPHIAVEVYARGPIRIGCAESELVAHSGAGSARSHSVKIFGVRVQMLEADEVHVVRAVALSLVHVRNPRDNGCQRTARCAHPRHWGLGRSGCFEGHELHHHSVRTGDLHVDLLRDAETARAEGDLSGDSGDAVRGGAG